MFFKTSPLTMKFQKHRLYQGTSTSRRRQTQDWNALLMNAKKKEAFLLELSEKTSLRLI